MQSRFAAFGIALPGRSIQSLTVSPGFKRRAASAAVCSTLLTKTLPRSIAERAFDLEPSRSAAASHLSSRNPDSNSLTFQFWSFIAGDFYRKGSKGQRGEDDILDCDHVPS